ncbi:protein-glutamate methylesterase/protein-glutamine glutaminase [Hoeflea prorocentri]|uniref:Protein-glutamate methylesterase/protein-glutamine glutaminase n=1 Tax=Hoeflea prorocentri TaxID=1922333 RepID=A0A9X3UNQ8_9HYPH|nr:chemotaxis response regulator protein-glutamate methylesterase [Hoeflea prorocentri]MCY6382416.1 chemotaxis response regulator protein-glutamate methylesterase [Hoeflea prorocentri]MDA5400216.1 chemotaxis response regulator protein-glutamate methylesterase [Hoeflea prorocentri]
MLAKPVRVLVVDDSATMRSLISSVLQADPDIEVVGTAGDAAQARSAIKQLNPDVITLDVEMPNMNGLEFLEKIMRLRPMPVIMVSTLTSRGAEASLAALELGAFDCIGKPAVTDPNPFPDLAEKVKQGGKSKARIGASATAQPTGANGQSDTAVNYRPGSKVVAIGASTGGVEALISLLSTFPANCPPTLITQHMPEAFTSSFAARLDRLCKPQVAEASDGAPIRPGMVYVAPGGQSHLEIVGSTTLRCRLREGEAVNGHRPSVDVLFNSVAAHCGRRAVGVILTGMGRDGASGLLQMRQGGAATIGQNESTCVVYGMPRSAFEIGAVENQLPLRRIGEEILNLTTSHREGTR